MASWIVKEYSGGVRTWEKYESISRGGRTAGRQAGGREGVDEAMAAWAEIPKEVIPPLHAELIINAMPAAEYP